jgi:hypothetical protein
MRLIATNERPAIVSENLPPDRAVVAAEQLAKHYEAVARQRFVLTNQQLHAAKITAWWTPERRAEHAAKLRIIFSARKAA